MNFKKLTNKTVFSSPVMVLFILLITHTVNAQSEFPYDFSYNGNPLVRNHGAADPDAHVWNDTVWLYCSQDHDGGYEFMDGYHAFSSTDMINWTDHGEILHSRDVSWGRSQGGYMWAPGAAKANGKYYLYFPHKDKSENWKIGVAISDRPEGPFTDMGHPLEGIGGIDPAIFIDDDGQAYIYNNNAIVAKLKPNMVELAESTKGINYDINNAITDGYTQGFNEGSYMHKRNGIYYYSYSNWHNNQYQSFYAIGDNPYGPFEWQGPMSENPQGAQDHHSVIEFKGQWYYFYHIAISGIPENKDGQGRIACYDRLFYNSDGTQQLVLHSRGPKKVINLQTEEASVTLNPPGGAYNEGTEVTVKANTIMGFGFESWGGDLSGTENPMTIVMDSDKSIAVNYTEIATYTLDVESNNGNVLLDPPGGTYNVGTTVRVTCKPNLGYKFKQWTGDINSSENPISINMDANRSIKAEYESTVKGTVVFATNCGGDAYQSVGGVQFSKDNGSSGGGTYSKTKDISLTADDVLYHSERNGNFSYNIDLPNGNYDVMLLFAEIFHNASGKRIFDVAIEGTKVINNLDIVAKAGSNVAYGETHRVSLNDGELTIKFTTDKDNAKVSAIKIIKPENVPSFSLSTEGVNGTITADPAGDTHEEGSLVWLTANPNEGYRFTGWSGDLSGTGNPSSITMDADKNIVANFEAIPLYSLNISAENGAVTRNPEGGEYEEGTVVNLTAIPDDGYVFFQWSGDLSDTLETVSTIMDNDKNITAEFKKKTAVNRLENPTLLQNYPNPFSMKTTIAYKLDKPAHVRLSVFSLLGEKLLTLVNEQQQAGFYQTDWKSTDDKGNLLPNGIYFYRLEIDQHALQMRKAVLAR